MDFFEQQAKSHRKIKRALSREEMAASRKQFDEIMGQLPQNPITPKIEQQIEGCIRRARAAERQRGRHRDDPG